MINVVVTPMQSDTRKQRNERYNKSHNMKRIEKLRWRKLKVYECLSVSFYSFLYQCFTLLLVIYISVSFYSHSWSVLVPHSSIQQHNISMFNTTQKLSKKNGSPVCKNSAIVVATNCYAAFSCMCCFCYKFSSQHFCPMPCKPF